MEMDKFTCYFIAVWRVEITCFLFCVMFDRPSLRSPMLVLWRIMNVNILRTLFTTDNVTMLA